MDSFEFNCQQCDTLLRVKQQDQAKLIRCPNCQHLQRYVDRETFRSVVTANERSQPILISNNEETWSLRTESGREIHGLTRTEFEQLLQQGHANSRAFFIGGDYRQWTPVQKLYESATGTNRSSQPAYVVPQPSYAPPSGSVPDPLPNHGPTTSSYNIPNNALPLEQQLPDGNGIYVLILGVISIVTFCFPVIGVVGLILGTVDAVRLGNGDISGRYTNPLIIGILCCLFSVFLFGCTSCRIRF